MRPAGLDSVGGGGGGVGPGRTSLRAQGIRVWTLSIADDKALDPLVKLEQLQDVRDKAAELGVLDEVVDLPRPWRSPGSDRVTIADLISGAVNVDLAHSGETIPHVVVDPWDVDPATRPEATS